MLRERKCYRHRGAAPISKRCAQHYHRRQHIGKHQLWGSTNEITTLNLTSAVNWESRRSLTSKNIIDKTALSWSDNRREDDKTRQVRGRKSFFLTIHERQFEVCYFLVRQSIEFFFLTPEVDNKEWNEDESTWFSKTQQIAAALLECCAADILWKREDFAVTSMVWVDVS